MQIGQNTLIVTDRCEVSYCLEKETDMVISEIEGCRNFPTLFSFVSLHVKKSCKPGSSVGIVTG